MTRYGPARGSADNLSAVPSPAPAGDVMRSPDAALRDARETDRLGKYVAGIWQRREYAWYVANSELKSRQINSLLGNLWHLLNPMLQIAVFYIFFGLVLEADRGVDNFVGYLTVGIFTYSFLQKSAMSGAKSLLKYRGLIQSITFPRALLPLTTTLTESLAVIPAYFVMLVVAVSTGEPITAMWLLLVPFYFVQVAMNAGVALIAARLAHHLPDVQQILPFVFRLGFYASGVLFNVNAYLDGSSWAVLFKFNPAYCLIEVNRGIMLQGTALDWELAAIACGWAVLFAVAGFVWFRLAEDSYGEG